MFGHYDGSQITFSILSHILHHQAVSPAINVRDDRRCGPKFPINGRASTCNPHGPHPCCSQWGWCGSSDAHCACPGCVDSREMVPQ